MKGLAVSVYKNGTDCTNGGITANCSRIVVFDEGEKLEGYIDPSASAAGPFLLVKRDKQRMGGYLYAVPATVVEGVVVPMALPAGHVGWMFGGNLISTCDSRFYQAFGLAVAVHDRSESYELYRSNCD